MIKPDQLPTNLDQIDGMIAYTQAAAESLGGAFIWDKTTQGHDYWAEVIANLTAIRHQMSDRKAALKGETNGNE